MKQSFTLIVSCALVAFVGTSDVHAVGRIPGSAAQFMGWGFGPGYHAKKVPGTTWRPHCGPNGCSGNRHAMSRLPALAYAPEPTMHWGGGYSRHSYPPMIEANQKSAWEPWPQQVPSAEPSIMLSPSDVSVPAAPSLPEEKLRKDKADESPDAKTPTVDPSPSDKDESDTEESMREAEDLPPSEANANPLFQPPVLVIPTGYSHQ